MTDILEFPTPPLAEITLAEPLADDELKRLPPLFYHEDEALESELLILKLVSRTNPNHEVYLYEHDGINLFSAMIVAKDEEMLRVSFDLVTVGESAEPMFTLVEVFKPRTVHDVIVEAELAGLKVLVTVSEDLLAEFGLTDA